MTLSFFEIYLSDTDALIDGFRNPSSRAVLDRLIREGRLRITPGVLEELRIGGDAVYSWAYEKREWLVVELTKEAAVFSGEITRKYGEPFRDPDNPGVTHPGLIKRGGYTDADPEVVSMGICQSWTVVSNDRSVRAACRAESRKPLSLSELLTSEAQMMGLGST
jgi:hypothetical protein